MVLSHNSTGIQADIWAKLYRLIQTLGYEGMSDEESDTEDGNLVLRVAVVSWRRPVGRELGVVDEALKQRPDLFRALASQPIRTVHEGAYGDRRVCMRRAFEGRPASFYGERFLKNILLHERKRLKVVEGVVDDFNWPTSEELKQIQWR